MLLDLGVHEDFGLDFIKNVFAEIARPYTLEKAKDGKEKLITGRERWAGFIARQLRGLIYELVAIYTFVTNGCCVHPFAFTERTIGKFDSDCSFGDFMVVCCPNELKSQISPPIIVQVRKSPSKDDLSKVPKGICGNLKRVLMYPKSEIKKIEDLDGIEFEILYPDGRRVSLRPKLTYCSHK